MFRRLKSGFTPLHYSVHFGRRDMFRLLIRKAADVNAKSKSGISALHVAANEGKEDMVDELIFNGADVSSKTNEGLTAIHCAAKHGKIKIISGLLEKGADVESKSSQGFTPLHTAVQHACLSCAAMLLQRGASLDAVNVDGFGVLHISSYFNQPTSVQFLLDSKCDIHTKTKNDLSALEIAQKLKHLEVENLLKSHGAVETTLSHHKKLLPFYTPILCTPDSTSNLLWEQKMDSEIYAKELKSPSRESIEAEITKLLCEDVKDKYKTTKTKTAKIVMRKRIRKQRVLDGDREHTLTKVESSMDDISQLPCDIRNAIFLVHQEFLEETKII